MGHDLIVQVNFPTKKNILFQCIAITDYAWIDPRMLQRKWGEMWLQWQEIGTQDTAGKEEAERKVECLLDGKK